MARDIVFDVLTEAKGRGLLDGARELDNLASSAERAERNLGAMGDGSGKVDEEIKRLRQSIIDTGREIDRTGNKSLFKDLNRDKSQLREFENLAKELSPIGEQAGQEFNKGFLGTMGELGTGLQGAVIPIAVGAIAAALPAIGGAVAGAVAGITGIGGIAGGIAMASKDNAVRQSARAFGSSISQEFFSGGQAFVAPIIESLDILQHDFAALDLGKAFEPLAKLLPTLAAGLGGFAKELMPGLMRAFEGMGPVIEALAEELPTLGKTLGDFFDLMTNSPGTVTGMRTLFMMLDGSIEILGQTIAFLANTWDALVRSGAAVTGALEDIYGAGNPLTKMFAALNDGLEGLAGIGPKVDAAWAPIPGRFNAGANAADGAAGAFSSMTMTIDELKNALDGLFSDQMNYDQAILAVKRDTLALTESVKANGTSLSDHTQKGLANQTMIMGLVQDYERQRQAAIKSGEGTASATRKFDDQVGALGRQLAALGFNRAEIDKLLGSYKKLHDQPDIHKEIAVSVHVLGMGALDNAVSKTMMLKGYDKGGLVDGPKGQPQLAVVHGGEYISTTDEVDRARGGSKMSIGGTGGGGGSGDVMTLRVIHETPTGEVLREELLTYKRQRGGAGLGFD